ncbi:hypothetical protein WJX84_012173, partial [Apatococcus fuscideae]
MAAEGPSFEEAKVEDDTPVYQPGATCRDVGDVPAGHLKSDLTPHACSIILGRRRDLTLRGDITLSRGNHSATLSQLLKGRTAIVFGVPDMGPVCSEKHVPGYLELMDEILGCGIDQVYCICHAPTEEVATWSESVGIEKAPKIEAWADDAGSLCRMLGLEASHPTASGQDRH